MPVPPRACPALGPVRGSRLTKVRRMYSGVDSRSPSARSPKCKCVPSAVAPRCPEKWWHSPQLTMRLSPCPGYAAKTNPCQWGSAQQSLYQTRRNSTKTPPLQKAPTSNDKRNAQVCTAAQAQILATTRPATIADQTRRLPTHSAAPALYADQQSNRTES